MSPHFKWEHLSNARLAQESIADFPCYGSEIIVRALEFIMVHEPECWLLQRQQAF